MRRPRGLPIKAGCDTARDQTWVCNNASSTVMQCLRPLRHSGGLTFYFKSLQKNITQSFGFQGELFHSTSGLSKPPFWGHWPKTTPHLSSAVQVMYCAFRKYSYHFSYSTFCCYSLNSKCFFIYFYLTLLHTIPYNEKVNVFRNVCKCIKYRTLIYISLHTPESIPVRIIFGSDYRGESFWVGL